MEATSPANLRHICVLLPLLPSGPGGVGSDKLRRTSEVTIAGVHYDDANLALQMLSDLS